MLLKKLKCIFLCTAMVLSGIMLSGCDSSSAELVDEITAEATASVTVETAKTASETISETTTVTTTETVTEVTTTETATEATTTTTTEADTEVLTEATTAALPEITTTTRTETTTETTQLLDLTPEELEVYNSMPDIVFVLSHCYDSASNSEEWYSKSRGFYVKKNGDIKMFNFIKDDGYYDIPERFEEIENYTCSEMLYYNRGIITQDDLDTVSIQVLIEQYEKLLLVDKSSKITKEDNVSSSYDGNFKLYGIRTVEKEMQEIILLSGWGDEAFYTNTDLYAKEISTCKRIIIPNY